MACTHNAEGFICEILQSVVIVGIMLSCFLFYIGPNFYSILIHRTEELHSVRAILQIVLLALIWFAGVSWVVKSRFIRFAILFTVSILVALLGIALLLIEDQRTAMRFLAPMAHFLGCLVGAVFGVYFKCFRINAVSGCLLGIISAVLIMQSIRVMCERSVLQLIRFLGLFLLKGFWLVLFHYAGWVLAVFLALSGDDKLFIFIALVLMGSSIISYLILNFTFSIIICQMFFAMILGLYTGFIGIVILAIVNKGYFRSIGIPIYTITGLFIGYIVIILSVLDVVEVSGNVTGNLVLCFTCRLVGAGIGSFLVLPLFSFFGLLASLLAEKAIRISSLSFIQSVWQYTANLGGRYNIVYTVFMWMKQNREGIVGSSGLFLAMLMGVGSGALLGGLCGHAVLMLANRSYDARVAGWSFMVSGSVVGALTAYSAFGLQLVPVGAFFGCSITAAIVLWRGGFNFKSYFQRTVQLGRVWEIFNRARMEH